MLQVFFEGFGDPSQVLQVGDVEEPTPGPGEVVVRLTSRGINPSDLFKVRGTYGHLPSLPAVPGAEGMGEVTRVGPGAQLRLGERVVPLQPLMQGHPGTWVEDILVRDDEVARVPREMPDEVAAQALINPLTAWCLGEELSFQPGDWVMLTAASSAVGKAFRQLAPEWGVRVINVVHRPDRVAALHQEGAEHVLCSANGRLEQHCRELTGGVGVVGVLDAAGGPVAAESIRCLRPGGSFISYGFMNGPQLDLDLRRVLFEGLTLKGFYLTKALQSLSPQKRVDTVESFFELLQRRHIQLPVDATYPLSRVREAVAHADRRFRSGKILLVNG